MNISNYDIGNEYEFSDDGVSWELGFLNNIGPSNFSALFQSKDKNKKPSGLNLSVRCYKKVSQYIHKLWPMMESCLVLVWSVCSSMAAMTLKAW